MTAANVTKIDVAVKANPALTLPALILAAHCQRNGGLSSLAKQYSDADVLPGSSVVQLLRADGSSLSDHAVVEFLTDIEAGTRGPEPSIRKWVDKSKLFTTLDFKNLKPAIDELNEHLLLRSYVVGYELTAADLCIWAALRGNRVAINAIKKASNNVSRWFQFVEASCPWIIELVAEHSSHASKDRAIASATGASYELGLPQFDAPMVTRFPPEPSGYLHIGHAKAALLNDYFAHKKKGGTLICRFDDTNPSKESMEFQEAIIDDLKMMEIFPDRTSFSSDYFQEMYEYAIKIIKDGKAFADDSELGKGDEDRKNRLPSKRRDLSIEDTLARFEDMKSGSSEGQRWCLRARIAYDSPNGTMRDPVIYRCNQLPHHRTGSAWKIYPTYDFCAPILDSLEGVTLALRTNEYRDRNVQYEWMQEALGLRKVPIWDFSRMNFVRTLLSKRKLTQIVAQGKVWGWDDPRMPTIRGILRRGMTVSALREFVLMQGPSRNVLNLEWGALWAMNKKEIDPKAPRHTAIVQDRAITCEVQGVEAQSVAKKPKHGKNPELGDKRVIFDKTIMLEQADGLTFETGEEITLMNWGNAFVREIVKDPAGQVISKVVLELHLAGDFKKTKKKVTWLAAVPENLVPIDIVGFDYLITKDKLEKEDRLEDSLTEVTEFRVAAFADCNVAELAKGAIVQFERKGYYIFDGAITGGSRLVFFEVPSGKTA